MPRGGRNEPAEEVSEEAFGGNEEPCEDWQGHSTAQGEEELSVIKTRYFGMLVDPRQYRRGFGLRGWWINLLNRLRVRIELAVAMHILRIEARNNGFSRAEVDEIVRKAKDDPFFMPRFGTENKPKERVSVKDKVEALYQTSRAKREGRYLPGRSNSDEPGPERPIPFEEGFRVTFAAHQRRNDRSARYVQSRSKFMVVVDGDGVTATSKHDPELKEGRLKDE